MHHKSAGDSETKGKDEMYTLNDLEIAKQKLKRESDRFDQYTGNNPDKYQSDIKSARRNVLIIEKALKTEGKIPLSEQEILEKNLDKAFPEAKSKQIVEYENQKFQRFFRPAERSRSGKTINEWDRGWKEVKQKE